MTLGSLPEAAGGNPVSSDDLFDIVGAFDRMDGVYSVIKDRDSVFLWVNQNFADLVGQEKSALIGSRDDRAEHVADDRAVISSGKPLLNLHETIGIPALGGGVTPLAIVTQKGLLRGKDGEIIGITVNFSKQYASPDAEAVELVERLSLKPILLGGLVGSGPRNVGQEAGSEADGRPAYSTNYYLLRENDVLRLHSLHSDEQWFFHKGSPIRLHIFGRGGHYSSTVLGPDVSKGQEWQAIVSGNTWFGAELLGPGYGFVSCSLTPGYDANGSSNPTLQDMESLMRAFPDKADTLRQLAPEPARTPIL